MRKFASIVFAAALGAMVLTGCGAQNGAETTAAATTAEAAAESGTEAVKDESQDASEASKEETTAEETAEAGAEDGAEASDNGEIVRVGGLKGPTTMGLVKLMDDAEKGTAENQYEFTMVTAADELTALVAGGKVDIALLPANVASVLYNKTEGGVKVIDINTLGVLYMVSADTSVTSIDQLKGRTVYLPGKGTTPEFALRYLISASGLSEEDVTLEFKSEAAEVAAVLAEDPEAIGLLPQPFVTSAISQNENLSIIMDLTAEWDKVQGEDGGSRLVTGVTIVNSKFLEDHQDLVDTFLTEHEASTQYTETDPEQAAELIAAAGIVAKAPLAQKALPYCSITFITGDEMKAALSGYLNVLFEQNPASVGGALPDDAFYYIP